MRTKTKNAVQTLTRIFSGIIEARVPMCVLLDFASFDLYKARLKAL